MAQELRQWLSLQEQRRLIGIDLNALTARIAGIAAAQKEIERTVGQSGRLFRVDGVYLQCGNNGSIVVVKCEEVE